MKKLSFVLIFMFNICTLTLLAVAQPPDTLWCRSFGGHEDDRGYGIACTDDGGFISCGFTYSFGATTRAGYIVKVDTDGNEVWNIVYSASGQTAFYGIDKTSDGGFICSGYTSIGGTYFTSSFLLLKINEYGDILWEGTYGGPGVDIGNHAEECSDGGYIMVGYSSHIVGEPADITVLKTDSMGVEEWHTLIGGQQIDEGNCICQTTDGGFILTGETWSWGTGGDVILTKLDNQGEEVWTNVFGQLQLDVGYCIRENQNYNYVVLGLVTPGNSGLICYDDQGQEVWRNRYFLETLLWFETCQDNTYILAGYSESELLLIKADETGTGIWTGILEYGNGIRAYCVKEIPVGGYVTTGYAIPPGSSDYNLLICRFAGEMESNKDASKEVIQSNQIPIDISPNPFNPITTISYFLEESSRMTLTVYDLTGREVKTLVDGYQDTGFHEATFDGSGLSSGMYLLKLEVAGASPRATVSKIVLMK